MLPTFKRFVFKIINLIIQYIKSVKKIQIKDKIIKIMKNLPKPKSVEDIQLFLDVANFYQQFINNFSRIARLFILILDISHIVTLTISNL